MGDERTRHESGLSQPLPGGMQALTVTGLRPAVYEVDGGLYYTSNVCTHAFALLTDGWLEGYLIECPLHAGQSGIRTGYGQGPPFDRPVQTYPVRLRNGQIEVGLPISPP